MNISRRQFLIGLSATALPGFALAQNHGHHGHMSNQASSNEQGHNHGHGHQHNQTMSQGDHAGHTPGMSHGTTVGREGRPQDVKQTIQIDMHDQNRFTPNRVELKAGETVRFFVRNMGQIKHEFVIGTKQELLEHAEMMKQAPHMAHEDPNMINLKPRQRGGVVWHFDKPGTYYFGCLEPGHFEGGMVGTIVVK